SCLATKYPNGEVNSYLVQGKSGVTVIDTGVNNEGTKQVWEQLISDGLQIEKVVLTHTHIDHAGLAAWLQQKAGVPIVLGKRSYEDMRFKWERLSKHQGDGGKPYAFIFQHGGPAY